MLDRNELLIKVATMFYEQGYTQTNIAKELDISRPTVASLLQEGRDKGIIRINIIKQYTNNLILEEKIKEKYNIKNVLVSPEDSYNPKNDVGILCADYIESRADENLKIGISFGTTVYEFVENAKYMSTNFKQITPLMGGVEMKTEYLHSNFLCYKLSSKYNCGVSFFYAPVIAESIEQKNILMESNLVQQALKEAKSVDIGVVGIGNPLKNSTYKNLGYLDDTMDELERRKAVGDICTSFYNDKAQEINTEFSNKFIGLSLDEIKNIPELVILATGKEKLESVRALVENRIVDVLIIDYNLAVDLV